MTLAGGTSVEMVRDRSAGCKRVDGHRDPATSLSRDGYNDRCQRAEAGRGPCCLHACLVTGAARPSRTICGSTRLDGRLGLVGLLIAFSGTYLIAVTGNFGFLAPALAKQAPAVLDSLSQY